VSNEAANRGKGTYSTCHILGRHCGKQSRMNREGRRSRRREGAEQHNIQTELAAKNYEDIREEHSTDGRLIPQKRELLNTPRLEETGNGESSVTKASAEIVPTHEEVDLMECGTMEQEEESVDTRCMTPPTQQPEQKEDIQSDGEKRGSEDQVLEADVWIAVGTPAHTDAEARTEAQPTRPKCPKKLKEEKRGSPARDRSKNRVRNMFKKVYRKQ
jgi:hypothetical protein